MSKAVQAVKCFNKGFNCSQSVFSTYCGQLGLDSESALKIACGFGAGMGRLSETCGAVSGAYMLIGLKYGQSSPDDKQAKEKTYELVRIFADRFEQRNKTTNCEELLGVHHLTGDKTIAAERVRTICPKMIRDAAEIIEELLELT